VNGSARNERTGRSEPLSGQWSIRFAGHPWVQQAEREGWGNDLRQAVIYAAKIRILRDEDLEPIERLMPDRHWVEAARRRAAGYAAAAEQRANGNAVQTGRGSGFVRLGEART
jgi:hypothetical protein